MDLKNLTKKIPELLKKYRYIFLVMVIGLVLMLLPIGNHTPCAENSDSVTVIHAQKDIGKELEAILSQIYGAGNVRVMLTVAQGEHTVYQYDEDITVSDNSNTSRRETITITDADRNQTGLIRQINPPVYQGAIIICQGADSPSVRLAILDAVSKATGLGADKISIVKMK